MHLFPSSYICTECTQVYLEQFTERNPETSWLTSSHGVNRESHTKTPRESWDTPGHKPHTQHRAIQPGGKPQLPASLWEWRIRNTHLVPPLLQLPPEWWPPKHLARKSPRRASRCALRHSAVSNSLQHHGLQPTRLLYPQSFPRKNIGQVAISYSRGSSGDPGIEFLFLSLLYWQAGSLQLCHLGSPNSCIQESHAIFTKKWFLKHERLQHLLSQDLAQRELASTTISQAFPGKDVTATLQAAAGGFSF